MLHPVSPRRAHASWSIEDRAPGAPGAASREAARRIVIRLHEIAASAADARDPISTTLIEAGSGPGSRYVDLPAPGMRLIADLCAESGGGFSVLARSNAALLPSDIEPPARGVRSARVRGASSELWRPRMPAPPSPPPPDAAPAPSPPPAARDAAPAPAAVSDLAVVAPPASDSAAAESRRDAPPADRSSRLESTVDVTRLDTLPLEVDVTAPEPSPADATTTFSSAAVPGPAPQPYLNIKVDLVVYGRAAPGTEIVIDGVQVPVRADGTFEIRFAIPNALEPPR